MKTKPPTSGHRCCTFLGIALLVTLVSIATPNSYASITSDFPTRLSSWGIFDRANGKLVVSNEFQAYCIEEPSFSDYAWKLRTISKGMIDLIRYENETPDMADGTILTKTFFYPLSQGKRDRKKQIENERAILEKRLNSGCRPSISIDDKSFRLIETRLLVKKQNKWIPLVYVWDESRQDAELVSIGKVLPMRLVVDESSHQDFFYSVPELTECIACHGGYSKDQVLSPLGWSRWQHGAAVSSIALGSPSLLLDLKARRYLDINCAHCHNPNGSASSSGLFLGLSERSNTSLGVCKRPVAAGSGAALGYYDIRPGNAEASLVVQRMRSQEPSVMMPEIGRSLADTEGIDLVATWINAMLGECL